MSPTAADDVRLDGQALDAVLADLIGKWWSLGGSNS